MQPCETPNCLTPVLSIPAFYFFEQGFVAEGGMKSVGQSIGLVHPEMDYGLRVATIWK